MQKSIYCVKGISGSGKSTRVFLLLSFLEKKCGLNFEEFSFENYENKTKIVGSILKELDLVLIGKKYKSGNFERFQGYDAVTSCFGKSSHFSDFLRCNSDKYSFIVEGAGVTATWRLRPKFLSEYCGFDNILIQYYNYDLSRKQDYIDRIVYRTGKEPVSDAMWRKCNGFVFDNAEAVKDKELLTNMPIDINIFYNLQDEPSWDFGVKFLANYDMVDFIQPFIDYCNSSTYLKDNSYQNYS